MWNWAPACLLVAGGMFVSAALTVAPRDPHHLAAVFPPWWSGAERLAAASSAGVVGRITGLPFILSVRGDDAELASRLRAEGAMLILDGSRLGFCGG